MSDVEYREGGQCFRLKDCPTTGRRLHRDQAAAENMIRKGLYHLWTGGDDWGEHS